MELATTYAVARRNAGSIPDCAGWPRRRATTRLHPGYSRSPRGRDALCLTVAGGGLGEGAFEKGLAVADLHPRLAIGSAAVSLALGTPIDEDTTGRRSHFDDPFHQHRAAAIQRNDVGGAEALAGDHHDPAALDRGIRNQGIADH